MADSTETPASSRSQRAVDAARKNPFGVSLGAAVPLLALLPALFEHLEKIQRINSALGYQIGTFSAVGLLVLGAYQRHQEHQQRDRDRDRRERERELAEAQERHDRALIAAMEREGSANREVFRDVAIDLKNAHAETAREVKEARADMARIADRMADITGNFRRPTTLGGGGAR